MKIINRQITLAISTALMLVGCSDIIENSKKPGQPLALRFVESGAPILKDLPADNVMFNALVSLEKDHNNSTAKLMGKIDLYAKPIKSHPALKPGDPKAYEGVELANAGVSFEIGVLKDATINPETMNAAIKKINGDATPTAPKSGQAADSAAASSESEATPSTAAESAPGTSTEAPAAAPEQASAKAGAKLDDILSVMSLKWDITKFTSPRYIGSLDMKWGDKAWPDGGQADLSYVLLKTKDIKSLERLATAEEQDDIIMPPDVWTDGMPKAFNGCQDPFEIDTTKTTQIDWAKNVDGEVLKEMVLLIEVSGGASLAGKIIDDADFALEPKYFIEPDKGSKAEHLVKEGETVTATLKLIRRYASLAGSGLTLTEVIEVCHGFIKHPKPAAAQP